MNGRTFSVLGVLGWMLLAGCSSAPAVGQLPDDDGTTNGGGARATAGRAGASGGGQAASSASAGVTSAGTANGGSSVGGTTSSTSAAPRSDTTNCPTWPASQLMPYIGLFFYGPDPGPCSVIVKNAQGEVVDNWHFTYEAGLLASETQDAGQVMAYAWADGLLATRTATRNGLSSTNTYGYYADSFVDTNLSTVIRYTLSATGYPTSVAVSTSSGAPRELAIYEYSDCRLVRRVVSQNGGSSSSMTYSYEYDAEGHVVARVTDDGGIEALDYSCW